MMSLSNEKEDEKMFIKSLPIDTINDNKYMVKYLLNNDNMTESCDIIDKLSNINESFGDTNEQYDTNEQHDINEQHDTNEQYDTTTNFFIWLFFLFIRVYTNIELFIKNNLLVTKPNKIEEIVLINSKSDYDYYSDNKIIASSKILTNRKNYDFALCFHDTNSNIRYVETIICHNKIKKRNTDISQKHFISVYFSINNDDYQLELDDEYMNFYLTNNIIDYTIINYLMFNKYGITISNVPYNLILIDHDSNVIIPKDTQYIRFYKNRYVIGDYD